MPYNPNQFSGHGLPAPLALEIAAQIDAGAFSAAKLEATGVPGPVAVRLAASLTGGETSAAALAAIVNFPGV